MDSVGTEEDLHPLESVAWGLVESPVGTDGRPGCLIVQILGETDQARLFE